MSKTTHAWLKYFFAVSLIPAILFGAGQGGITLALLVIILCLIIGLIGAGIHSSIYGIRSGDSKRVLKSICFIACLILFVAWVKISIEQCAHDPTYAEERVVKYIGSKNNLELSYLGKQTVSEEKCRSTFEYNDPNNTMIFIISEFGKIHFSR